MRKICVVLTARTSYAKIKTILKAIANHPDLELQIICAASAVLEKYGQTDKMVEQDGFVVNERIFMMVEGGGLLSAAKSTGMGLIEFAGAFSRLKPDAVLVMADRFEVLAPSIAATYQNIPLIHVQGGEVSGNIDEKVRHAITKLADLHFPATQKARQNIIRMGEDPKKVFHTGCPSTDIAKSVIERPTLDFDIWDICKGVGQKCDFSKGYYIVMQHSVTNEPEDGMVQIQETLRAMSKAPFPTLWFWPNIDAGSDDVSKGIRSYRENYAPDNMYFIKNMAPQDFLRVLYNSKGIIGNSSVAIREASYMGVPAVNIGSRQNVRERGPNVIDVPYAEADILKAVQNHCGQHTESSKIYGDGDAAQKIAHHIATSDLTYIKTLCD